MSGTDGLTFLDPVTVDAATTFQSAAGDILFYDNDTADQAVGSGDTVQTKTILALSRL